LVRTERLELSSLSAMASKTIVYTIPPRPQIVMYIYSLKLVLTALPV